MSRGQFHRRTDSRRRATGRGKSKGKTNDVIDVDCGKMPNVIILDPPESVEWTSPDASTSESDKAPVDRKIIYIDVNDDDSFEDGGSEDPHLSSIKKCLSASAPYCKNQPANDQGWKPSSKPSKCSRKISSRNQKKCTPSASCENNNSDCEIVEDYQGNIRQQWEEASLRKKMANNVPKSQSHSKDEFSDMGFNTESQHDINVDRMAEPHIPSCSSSLNQEKFNFSPSGFTRENVAGDDCAEMDIENQCADFRNTESQHVNMEKSAESPIPSYSSSPNQEECNLSQSVFVCQGMGSDTNAKSGENQLTDLEDIQQEISHRTSVCNMVSKSTLKTEPHVKLNTSVLVSNADGSSDIQNSIIGDREMLKKSDAYKRADEEEWASRHRELHIQGLQLLVSGVNWILTRLYLGL